LILLLCAIPAVSSAEGPPPALGRLFTSAEQRRQLDELLQRPTARQASNEQVERLPSIHLNGSVFRPQRRTVSWINGHSTLQKSQLSSGIEVQDHQSGRDQETIRLRYGSLSQPLKPGQVWLLEQRRVVEAIDLPPSQPLPTETEAAAAASLSETARGEP